MPESGPGTSPAWRRCCHSGISGRSHAPVTGDQGWADSEVSVAATGVAAAHVVGWLESALSTAGGGVGAISRRGAADVVAAGGSVADCSDAADMACVAAAGLSAGWFAAAWLAERWLSGDCLGEGVVWRPGVA